MDFRINITVEVDQVGNGLAIQTPVPMQLAFTKGRWSAECETPLVRTPSFPSIEEALKAGAQQIAMELQAAVCEQPKIVGRITPDNIPAGAF